MKATLRRRTESAFVEAPVTIRRGPDHSIHLIVAAPNGAAGSLRVDNLPRPAGPAFAGWARQQLGDADEGGGVVRLSTVDGDIEMWVYSPLFLGAINFARTVVPKPMKQWASRQLGLDRREA